MDPTRRSSRARASQPPKSESHHSSTSSNASTRGDRATRSHKKSGSPRKSTPSNSLSSESVEDAVAGIGNDISQTRRKSGRAESADTKSKKQTIQVDTAIDGEEDADDDEAVRCICEFEEYPGPPQFGEDNKHGIKDGIEEPLITPADITEDLAGFFLQCDTCKVWQHGGCVGIMNEDTSPEEYYCEQCRTDLHRVCTATNGQRFSYYLPLHQSLSRTTSRAPSHAKDGTRSPRGNSKSGRPSSSSMQGAKRRSTMNSRDAAYDEEEQLRRAIEASKGEGTLEDNDIGARRAKRGRSDSEEKPEGPKRQRTASSSPSPIPRQTTQGESDDGNKNKSAGGNKKIRGAAARNHREKEMREERERSRQEAANKRKGRAERRRAEDSDPSDDVPLAEKAAAKFAAAKTAEAASHILEPPSSSQISPDTPPVIPPSTSHKKGGRPPNVRKGKLGRNQYTKERDLENDDQSPHRSQSRDVRDEASHRLNAENKPGKSKPSPSSKITMNDLRKRVTSILDYIQRTQIDMAGGSSASSPNGSATGRLLRGLVEELPMIRLNGDRGETLKEGMPGQRTKEFDDLTVLEMMDVLTGQLVKWQKEFT